MEKLFLISYTHCAGIEADFAAWKAALWPTLKQALDGRKVKVKSCEGDACTNKCGSCGPEEEKVKVEGEGHHHEQGQGDGHHPGINDKEVRI